MPSAGVQTTVRRSMPKPSLTSRRGLLELSEGWQTCRKAGTQSHGAKRTHFASLRSHAGRVAGSDPHCGRRRQSRVARAAAPLRRDLQTQFAALPIRVRPKVAGSLCRVPLPGRRKPDAVRIGRCDMDESRSVALAPRDDPAVRRDAGVAGDYGRVPTADPWCPDRGRRA